MKLTALLDQIDELDLAGGSAQGVDVVDVTFDSREVTDGTLFVALPGSRVDGHRFVEAAAAAGAAAVLVEGDRLPFSVDCPVLTARDTRRTLGLVGAAFYDEPSDDLCLVGITGTNGKTTISWMLDRLFAAADGHSGLVGTIAYRWADHQEPAVNTTPESLVIQQLLARMRDDDVRRVAMEVSSHGLATHRLRGTHFDAAIFTNFTQDHLDFHGTMDAYREAKGRLFAELLPESAAAGKAPVAIINADDPAGPWFAERARGGGAPVVTFGVEADADWRAVGVEQTLDGSRFVISGPQEDFPVASPLLGDFNVSNALAAAVAARTVGVPVGAIQAGFGALANVPGRMQRVEAAGGPAVFVDYAHTPDALARALATVRPLAEGRLIVVFGCGGDRDRDKRAPMGEHAVSGADVAVVTSDNPRGEPPRAIIDQILEGMSDAPRAALADIATCARGVCVEVDRAAAIAAAIGGAGVDDVVLIAGKGHETYQEIDGRRVPFDDARQARQALSAHH